MKTLKIGKDRQNDREQSLDDLESISGGKPSKNAEGARDFLKVQMKEVLITSIQLGGS